MERDIEIMGPLPSYSSSISRLCILAMYCFQILLLHKFCQSVSASTSNSNECLALLVFSQSLVIDSDFDAATRETTKTLHWGTAYTNGTNCCEWDGVTCDSKSGHVIGVGLSSKGLHGQLHPNSSLFHLTHLQTLDLAFNHFIGLIPPSLGNLKQLSYMDLSWNVLSGPIPPSLGNLTKLSVMSLSRNNLSGPIPPFVGNLTRLSEIGLSWNNLIGPIPLSVGNLKQLSNFQISANNFNGPIPSFFGSLTQLSSMDLSQNHFSGPIPSFLGSLTQLSFIDLSQNHFSGPIPAWLFSDLPNLEFLSLGENKLNGYLPSLVRHVHYHELSLIDLSNNLLTGHIPAWCFTFPSIKYIYLSFNQFDLISEFSRVTPFLKELLLDNNNLQGPIPMSIFEFMNLRDLDLSSNNLSGFFDLNMFSKLNNLYNVNISHNNLLSFSATEPVVHGALPELVHFDFSYCNASDFPIFLKQAPNLGVLHLSNNNIHGEVPKWFQDCSISYWNDLQFIDLSSNYLEGEIPMLPRKIRFFSISDNKFTGSIFCSMLDLPFLEILDLSHNKLSDKIPRCLRNLNQNLIVLDLEMNHFHGRLPETFMINASRLETLKLGGNKFEGQLPRTLASCEQLQVLDIGNNQFDEVFPDWLEGLPNLQVLVLRGNKFHGFITNPKSQHPFPKLRILDVSNNNFSGPLPYRYIGGFKAMMMDTVRVRTLYMEPNVTFVSYQDSVELTLKGFNFKLSHILTILITIDMSNNMFEGEIPQVVGNLRSLKGLNLSHNMLKGSIPQSFANLSSLEWLDLSSNKLRGTIPVDLTHLTSLGNLNLSYNQLTGSIPKGNQFGTFSNSSYIGNDGLCGEPLSRECGKDNGEPSPPYTSSHDEDRESHVEMGFEWKSVILECACGFVFGGSIAYFLLSTGKPWWLVKILHRSKKLTRLYLLTQ